MTAHICSYLSSAAARCAGKPMFACGSRTVTARQMADRVSGLSVGLAQRLGMQPGDCVCLAALATDHNLEALLAITAAGGIAAPLNWRWAAAEGAHATELVDAKLLVADAACLDLAIKVAAGCPCVRALVLLGSPSSYGGADLGSAPVPIVFAEMLMAECRTAAGLLLRTAPGGAALLVYTSGTTGKPKGVVLSHAALHVQSLAKLLMVGYSRRDVYLHAAPLFHIGGLSSALAMLMAGARHVFLPRFEPTGFLRAVRAASVTSFIAVPAMAAALLDVAGVAGGHEPAQCESVTTILMGGGDTSPALQAGLKALFSRASVLTAYGMTEAGSSMTFHTLWSSPAASQGARADALALPAAPCAQGALEEEQGLAAAWVAGNGSGLGQPSDGSRQPGAEGGSAAGSQPSGVFVGAAPPGIELAVYHPPLGPHPAAAGRHGGITGGTAWGRVVQEGEGEIVTRGPHVMLGYWEDEAATQAAFLPGGWMRTGDLGCMRQGKLWLVGRAKDMIKSGGENVNAWEVERALGSHPAVAAVAVVGVSDWRLGEAVAAALVLRGGWEWRAPRCQLLLQSPRAQAAQVSAAAAAAAAAAAESAGALTAATARAAAAVATAAAAGSGAVGEAVVADALDALVGGQGGTDTAEEAAALRLQAAGQRLASRGAGAGRRGAAAGAMVALAVEEGRHLPGNDHSLELLQLERMATGLLQLSALSVSGGSHCAGVGNGGQEGERGSPGSNWVDGPALQRHCRGAGLAGFKLPRLFLALPAGETLPANSMGKVLKHLVRERVGQEMQLAQAQVGPWSKL